MRVRFDEWGKLEFDEARSWYTKIRPELGRQFAAEVRAAGQRIAHQPLLYPLETGDVRKCVLTQFPYKLRYAVRGDVILIVAVSHHQRHPDYWVDRGSNQ